MTRILLADDHTVVRKGIIQIIKDDFPFAQIGEVSNGEELIKVSLKQEWDMVITDITMAGRSGLEALRQIRLSKPDLPVLILSMHPENEYAVRVLKAGASGYLNKETASEDLVKAIKKILSGRKYISEGVANAMLSKLIQPSEQLPHQKLSDRELEVMKLIASGKSITEIAEQFNLSITTVSTYRGRVLSKMNLQTNAGLTEYVLRNKLI